MGAFVVVAFVVTAVVVLRSDDVVSPLSFGSAAWLPGEQAPIEFGDHTNVVPRYQHGQEYEFFFDLRNKGRYAVTVDKVDAMTPPFSLLQIEEEELSMAQYPYETSPHGPFRPFTLKPGAQRGILFRGVFSFCDAGVQGYMTGLGEVTVHYHVLGQNETQTVTMNNGLAVVLPSPRTSQCPVPPAVTDGQAGHDRLEQYITVGNTTYDVWIVPDVAPPSMAVETPAPACAGSAPPGTRAIPFYLDVRETGGAAEEESGAPLDLRLTLSTSGRPLAVRTGTTSSCGAATPVHILAGSYESPAVIRGVAYVDPTQCPTQEIRVEARQPDGSYRDAGYLRLFVPCS